MSTVLCTKLQTDLYFILYNLTSFYVYFLDINECQQSPSVCHSLAKCSNTGGSYSCQCQSGYTGHGTVNCLGKPQSINCG